MAQDNTPADFVQEKTVIKRQKSITQLLKEIEEAMRSFLRKAENRSIL